MKENPLSSLPLRERVLGAAAQLFCDEGIRSVGMEAIAARALTTKMAIYRHFDSKDGLIGEWLRELSGRQAAMFDRLAARYPENPMAQLSGWLEQTIEQMYEGRFRGSPFANALAELPDRNHPARKVIERHQEKQMVRLEALCRSLGAREPGLMSAELTFLLEGAHVTVQYMSVTAVGDKVLTMARGVIARAGLSWPA